MPSRGGWRRRWRPASPPPPGAPPPAPPLSPASPPGPAPPVSPTFSAGADPEIALVAGARGRGGAADPGAPSLRLAPVMRLGHNFSVDLYMELVAQARLVVARLLGGSAYWPYGVERLVETCREHGIPLALLPGDDKPDAELARESTVPQADSRRLWRYLAEGGPGNADNFLRYAATLLNPSSQSQVAPHPPTPSARGDGPQWAEPAPLLRARP